MVCAIKRRSNTHAGSLGSLPVKEGISKYIEGKVHNETTRSVEMNTMDQKVSISTQNIETNSIDKSCTAISAPDQTEPPSTAVHVQQNQRTFATSNFKRCYEGAQAPMFQHRLLAAVHDMLKLFVRRISPALDLRQLDEGTNAFMKDIQGEAFRHNEVLEKDVGAAAEYLWTSAKTHAVIDYKQLYSVINAVIRDDVAEEVQTAVVFCRAINTRRVRRINKGADDMSYPRNGETWRGGGFRSEHRVFFERILGNKYRVPGFLATSTERWIAEKFADEAYEDNGAHPCVIWRVTFDPRGEHQPQYRVRHMTFVSKSLIKDEQEYLFAPYSVFTLVSTQWSPIRNKPHEITILASHDNKREDENLPLVPWY